MPRLAAAAAARQAGAALRRGALGGLRPLTSLQPSHAASSEEVLVEGKASARASVLNRPGYLNALTTTMGARLNKFYESWEDNPDIGFVMMKGSGRAFCAGGDVVRLRKLVSEGKMEECQDFFKTLYSFIYFLGTYLKPHVAILDGVTMGGGGGVSIPGTFRIATDRTVFATPEVHIGFHPDAAASFYLSHLTGHVGEYVALTGEKLNGADMIALGLATHYSMSEHLDLVDERLAKLVTDDPSVIDSSLAQYGDMVYPDKKSIVHRLEVIDKCFGHETVEEIVDALESEVARLDEEWCTLALKRLKEASPLALKVSLRSGVRARLVEKDLTPKWDPPALEYVTKDMVDAYFAPLGEFDAELKLPTETREAFV
ncbi:3-hydroxyisobutyryl-CoA hydrolase-like protein 2, mitochondrial isoform X2 [Panicum virgatum]|uniref:3-hydroxyisobutyryl-CoA hydrolase-like protein 2, mitochondrial isoform X2 n=1 Tax=Panicum virgatum TaxID=38727 RepID=UPI0019D686F2|nr:3-hydroxyisobutyryl-CoA hydrolase-like protein 2, mitochondrial isoform X2 [Panicum virgatum]